MKRKIKFRAWNKSTKTMVDLLAVTPLALSDFMNTQLASQGGSGLFIPFSGKLELMQFTGLHDKNGKEIYEGDIVKCDELIMTVEFVQSSFCKCNENGNWIIHSHDNIEVIGNLYENYELINIKS